MFRYTGIPVSAGDTITFQIQKYQNRRSSYPSRTPIWLNYIENSTTLLDSLDIIQLKTIKNIASIAWVIAYTIDKSIELARSCFPVVFRVCTSCVMTCCCLMFFVYTFCFCFWYYCFVLSLLILFLDTTFPVNYFPIIYIICIWMICYTVLCICACT